MWAILKEMVDSWRVCWSHRRGKQREPTVFLFAFIPELWMVVQKLVRSSAWQHFRMFFCLFVCLFICWMWTVGIAVERVLVTGWETLRTSGRTLCAVQRQNIVSQSQNRQLLHHNSILPLHRVHLQSYNYLHITHCTNTHTHTGRQ